MKALIFFIFASIPSISAQDCRESLIFGRTGDLIFMSLELGEMGRAIEAAEKEQFGEQEQTYNHVGVIIRKPEGLYVVESLPVVGVVLNRLVDVLERIRHQSISFAHLKNSSMEQRIFIRLAAESLLGTSYNPCFDPDDEGYYCSSLIFEIFERADIGIHFRMTAMTLGSPKSRARTHWKNYFDGAKMPIGKPGISPMELWVQAHADFEMED